MIKDAEAALDECRDVIRGIVRSMDQFLKQGLPKLMVDGYDTGDLPAMKTAAPDEHEEHLNHHLMFIEEAILQFRVCLAKTTLTSNVPLQKPQAGRGLKVDAPSAQQHDNDSDDDPETGLSDVPWSRKELRERAR